MGGFTDKEEKPIRYKKEPKWFVSKFVRKKYKLFVLMIAGLLNTSKDYFDDDMVHDLPSALFMFVVFGFAIFILFPFCFLEGVSEWLVYKIHKNKEYEARFLSKGANKHFKLFTKWLEDNYNVWIKNESPTYEEKYVYYRYLHWSYKVSSEHKNTDPNQFNKNLKNLAERRDEARSNYLIIKLAGLKPMETSSQKEAER